MASMSDVEQKCQMTLLMKLKPLKLLIPKQRRRRRFNKAKEGNGQEMEGAEMNEVNVIRSEFNLLRMGKKSLYENRAKLLDNLIKL